MSKIAEFATLATGAKMPIVGLGTWKSAPGEVAAAVKTALESGYRHIDCAAIYGNEKEIGGALAEVFEKGDIKREDVFITSKLWNTFHHPDDVEPACKQTLEDLGLDYVDLYLIHWPICFARNVGIFPRNEDGTMNYDNIPLVDTWKAMEGLVEKGYCKAIGLSNFNKRQIEDIQKVATVPIAALQIEAHPYLTQKKLIGFCKENNIVVTAYSPLGSPDRPWAKPDEPYLLQDERVAEIAKKYGKTVAQILIHYQAQRGVVVIPKSSNPERIKANFDVFDFVLSDEDVELIESFNKDWRACNPTVQFTFKRDDGQVGEKHVPRDAGHPEYPFHDKY